MEGETVDSLIISSSKRQALEECTCGASNESPEYVLHGDKMEESKIGEQQLSDISQVRN